MLLYRCTAQQGCTLDRPGSTPHDTPLAGWCALEGTPPHTGGYAGGEALHRSGSEWRSLHKRHSQVHRHDTAGLQDNPCWDNKRDVEPEQHKLCTSTTQWFAFILQKLIKQPRSTLTLFLKFLFNHFNIFSTILSELMELWQSLPILRMVHF